MNVTVNTGGPTFILNFDAASSAASVDAQNFRAGIIQAASILSSALTDHITISLNIDYTGTGGGAFANVSNGVSQTYTSVANALKSHAAAGDTTFNNMTTAISGSSMVDVSSSEAKALGFMSANNTSTADGYASFATDIDPASLVGVAIHELTHAMGRIPGSTLNVFDLFRFTAPNTPLIDFSIPSVPAYFSINGGVSEIASYGTDSDPSDFNNSGIQGVADSVNEYYTGITHQYLTAVDLEQLVAIGFHVPQSPAVIAANLTTRSVTDYTPLNSVPGSMVFQMNTPLALAGFSVGDVAGDHDVVTVKFSAQHGTISMYYPYGGVVVSGDGTGTVTLSGDLFEINLTLSGLAGGVFNYTPKQNYQGSDTITVTSTHVAQTGGPWTSTSTVGLTSSPVNQVATIGSAGANGANGASAGQAGGNGLAGQTISGGGATSASSTNIAVVVGGSGGNGGNGAAGLLGKSAGGTIFVGPGGNGGSGGAGGGAKAAAATNAFGPATAQGTATGGLGGSGGAGGAGAPQGSGNTGGSGGSATATASAANSASTNGPGTTTASATATANASGGSGGTATGSGAMAGAGGTASGSNARATSTGAGTVLVAVSQTGGTGGAGSNGAKGGAGAASTLTDAVSGQTLGGVLNLNQTAVGGAGGYSDQSAAGVAGSANSVMTFNDPASNITFSNTVNDQVTARGGLGGSTSTGTASNGGSAIAGTNLTGRKTVNATVTAMSGAGGAGGVNASGGGGGGAKATAVAASQTAGSEAVSATATAVGGNGGSAAGNGFTGGTGGPGVVSSASASSAGNGAVKAAVSQTSGNGGAGWNGAKGGAGAASTLTNAASGISNGGSVTLTQSAFGGSGGATTGGGAGGAGGYAKSVLNDNDTANATKSLLISATIGATGGNGGKSDTGAGGNGGLATANATITGAGSVSMTAAARGGAAGLGSTNGVAGGASATSTAIGTTQVYSTAKAAGGLGSGSSGSTSAKATGNSGFAQAQSWAQLAAAGTTGVLVDSLSAAVSTKLAGKVNSTDTAEDVAIAQFGVAAPAIDVTDQGVANVIGAPTGTNVSAVLAANSNINKAFAVTPSYFGIVELGASFTTAGTLSETTTATVTESVDLNQLATRQDLLVGLYGGTLTGTGVTGVVLTIKANGTTLLSQTFASGAAAQTYFTNHAVDLGSLNGSLYASGIANLTISLAVTSTSAGSGFFGSLLVGDPPKAATASNTFADWAHQLGATGYHSGDLASTPATAPLNDLSFGSLGQSGGHMAHARLV